MRGDLSGARLGTSIFSEIRLSAEGGGCAGGQWDGVAALACVALVCGAGGVWGVHGAMLEAPGAEWKAPGAVWVWKAPDAVWVWKAPGAVWVWVAATTIGISYVF